MPGSANPKDLFSSHASTYAAFRPHYPKEIYDFILGLVDGRDAAWDCATGNGQVARDLAPHFRIVNATDISRQQLDAAHQADNIRYAVMPAEVTNFADASFDLVTVAQALHWIDTTLFYQEARRVAKHGAVIAVWGYNLPRIDEGIDRIISHFYREVVGPYWDAARKLVDQQYRSIPFPFSRVPTPEFNISTSWTSDHLLGYLTSWSATQKYLRDKESNPLDAIAAEIRHRWKGNETKEVRFPIFMKVGRIG